MELIIPKLSINVSDKAFNAITYYRKGIICLNTDYDVSSLTKDMFIEVYAGTDKQPLKVKQVSKYYKYGKTLFNRPELDGQIVGENIVLRCLKYDEDDCIVIEVVCI